MEKVEDEDEDEDGLDEGMKAGSRHYLLADGRILGIKAVGISRGNSSNSRAFKMIKVLISLCFTICTCSRNRIENWISA